MPDNKHTPTPCAVAEESAEGGRMFSLGDNDDYGIVVGPNQESFAAFIVRACNAHAALVEALEAVVTELSAYYDGANDANADDDEALSKASDALKLAKES